MATKRPLANYDGELYAIEQGDKIDPELIDNSDLYEKISAIHATMGDPTTVVIEDDFSENTGWSLGTGWSIAGGVATHTGAGSYLTKAVLTAGTQYRIVITVTAATATDLVQIYLGDSPALLPTIVSPGTYTFTGVAKAGILGFSIRGTGNVSVDLVKVSETPTLSGTLLDAINVHDDDIELLKVQTNTAFTEVLITARPGSDTEWTADPAYATQGEISFVAEASAAAGYVMAVGNNAGSDLSVRRHKYISLNPNKLYRMRARVRRQSGSGNIFLGIVAQNADKTSVITKANAVQSNTSLINAHYFASGVTPGSLTEYVAYFKGRAAGAGGGTGTITDPYTFAAQTAYIAPMYVFNNPSNPGTVQFDYFIIEDADAIEAVSTKEPAFTKNTAFNKNFGSTAGTVAEGNHTHTFASVTDKPTTLAGYGITDAASSTHTHNSFTGDVTLAGDFLPDLDNTRSLGSPTLMWKDVYIGPGSLYLNGQKILEDTQSGTIRITADSGQNISVQTYGTGDIELAPQGTGVIQFKGSVLFDSASMIRSSSGSPLVFDDSIQFSMGTGISGELTIDGNVTWHAGNFTPTNKLDASAYTASDVLSKLLTVDGVSSALDADLLDGQHGSHYLAWANLTGVPSTFTPSAHNHAAGDITTGTFANERISEASVTQHETALTINWSQLTGTAPSLLVTDTYPVASEVEQLALSVQKGDIAIRSDISRTFVHNGGTAGTMADWSELLNPTGGVQSFNGRVGAVTPASNDYTFAQIGSKPTTLAGYGITDAVINTRTITAGNGLSGGGTLAANRTITLATPGTLSGTSTNGVTSTSHTHALSANLSAWDAITPADKADASHTHAFSTITATPTTLAGYGITDAANVTHTHAFSTITGTPSTLGGYGITDAVALSGDQNIAGIKTFASQVNASAGLSIGTGGNLTIATATIQSPSIVSILNGGAAQGIKVGSLKVSSSYAGDGPTNGIYSLGQIQSAVSTGTAPLIIASTTVVTNLNADLLDGQHGSYYSAWANITGKPTTLAGYGITDAAPLVHTHAIVDVTGLQTALDGKESAFTKNTAFNKNFGTVADTVAEGNHTHTFASLTDKPTTLAGYGITDALNLERMGARSTAGVQDWNDVSNTRPGAGYTLLLGTHANGPGGQYYHAFNFEYGLTRDGTGNVVQMALPYGNAGDGATGHDMYIRSRYGGSWNSWAKIWNSFSDGVGSGLDADLLDGQEGSYYSAASHNHDGAYVNVSGDTMTGDLSIDGTLSATTKSFLIKHPTKEGKKLRYGSLEGPENGVYIRGRCTDGVVEFPDYWPELVHEDSITIQLTPAGKWQKLSAKVQGNKVVIKSHSLFRRKVDCYYIINAERKDVARLVVESE